jgi:hypothetical protein
MRLIMFMRMMKKCQESGSGDEKGMKVEKGANYVLMSSLNGAVGRSTDDSSQYGSVFSTPCLEVMTSRACSKSPADTCKWH